jgi:hypothetical protein
VKGLAPFCHQLEHLVIIGGEISRPQLRKLALLPYLRALTIEAVPNSDDVIRTLATSTTLRIVDIKRANLLCVRDLRDFAQDLRARGGGLVVAGTVLDELGTSITSPPARNKTQAKEPVARREGGGECSRRPPGGGCTGANLAEDSGGDRRQMPILRYTRGTMVSLRGSELLHGSPGVVRIGDKPVLIPAALSKRMW